MLYPFITSQHESYHQSIESYTSSISELEEALAIAQSRMQEYIHENQQQKQEIIEFQTQVKELTHQNTLIQNDLSYQIKTQEEDEKELLAQAEQLDNVRQQYQQLQATTNEIEDQLQQEKEARKVCEEEILRLKLISTNDNDWENKITTLEEKIKAANTARLDDYRSSEKKREEMKRNHEKEHEELFNELKEANERALRAETAYEKLQFECSLSMPNLDFRRQSTAVGFSLSDAETGFPSTPSGSKTVSKLGGSSIPVRRATLAKGTLPTDAPSSSSSSSSSLGNGVAPGEVQAEARKRISKLQADLDVSKTQNQQYALRIKALEREVRTLQQSVEEIAELKTEITNKQTELSKINLELSTVKEKLVVNKKEFNLSTSKVETLTKQIKQAEKSQEKDKQDAKQANIKLRQLTQEKGQWINEKDK